MKENFCVAFAGDTHVNPTLSKQNLFIPNIIEEYVERYDGNNSLVLINELIKYLLTQNPSQNTELFISCGNQNSVDVHYVTLPSPQINTISTSFGLLYSTKSGLPTESVRAQFEKILNETLSIKESDILKDLPQKTEAEIVNLLKAFYKSVFSELNPKVQNSIGESIDIAIVYSGSGKFDQIENKTIKEIGEDQGVNI